MPSEQVETLRQRAASAAAATERLVVDGFIATEERIPFSGGTLQAIGGTRALPSHAVLLLP